jgi:hypothetical protein
VSKCAEYPQLWRGSRVLHEVLLGLFQEHPGVGDLGEDRMIEYEPQAELEGAAFSISVAHTWPVYSGE